MHLACHQNSNELAAGVTDVVRATHHVNYDLNQHAAQQIQY